MRAYGFASRSGFEQEDRGGDVASDACNVEHDDGGGGGTHGVQKPFAARVFMGRKCKHAVEDPTSEVNVAMRDGEMR